MSVQDLGAGIAALTINPPPPQQQQQPQQANNNNNNNNNNANNLADPFSFTEMTPPAAVPIELLPNFTHMLTSEEPRIALHGAMMIRKLLAVNSDPPISQVIRAGAVPHLVRLLHRTDDFRMLLEACWAVSNVASGSADDNRYVVELGAVAPIIHLLSCPDDAVREQAAWAIGNMAGESAQVRDMLLHEFNAMPALLQSIMMPTDKISTTRNAVWAISNLCRHKPLPRLQDVACALPVLTSLVNHTDQDVVIDALWTISYIGEGPPDRVQAVINSGVINSVVRQLSSVNFQLQLPAIRVIGNLATGTKSQSQIIFASGAAQSFRFLINHPRRTIRKEAVWAIGNLLVGDTEQIQQVINLNIVPDLLKCLNDSDAAIRLEALYACSTLSERGTPEQIKYAVDNGLLQSYVQQLGSAAAAPKDLLEVICGLNSLMQLGLEIGASQSGDQKQTNPLAKMFMELGGAHKLESLMEHPNHEVYEAAVDFGDTYFPKEADPSNNNNNGDNNNNDDNDNQNNNNNGGVFHF